MIHKKVPIVWILIGLFELYLGVSAYHTYSSGGFFLYTMPEQIEMKNIFFGLLSIWVGVGLLVSPKVQVKFVYSLPIWVIFFIFTGTLQSLINWKSFDLEYFLILDYWFIILSISTWRELKKEQLIIDISWKGFVQNNWPFLFLGGIFLNTLIFVLAELLPYEMFY